MTAPYPQGDARAIANARANGLKPSETVLIVAAGTFDWPNPTVYVDPQRIYRWDWLRGLGAVVLIDSKTRLGTTVQDIDQAEPTQLDVIDFERGLGWLVNFTKPSIRTSRWPTVWVRDWLGAGYWHRDLADAKAHYASQVVNQRNEFQPEAIWN